MLFKIFNTIKNNINKTDYNTKTTWTENKKPDISSLDKKKIIWFKGYRYWY